MACSEIWWQGPKKRGGVRKAGELFPQSSSVQKEIRTRGRYSKAEVKEGQESTLTVVTGDGSHDWRLNLPRFSSWTRLARIHEWVSRFLDNCCLPKEQRVARKLDWEEIKSPEN